ncbi:hypothetical protein F5X68DRAFT_259290 [Plectosphaerella plurivora]|uniref:Uncharacterized protein n=1 Tax=Plectosphaerella plurivora TaxID=936078 RepID=A0A9P8VHS9_9PEZI|nr:hypothetical protein F5X68DRAFT_259290 [Plectosphaerella plurivora]
MSAVVAEHRRGSVHDCDDISVPSLGPRGDGLKGKDRIGAEGAAAQEFSSIMASSSIISSTGTTLFSSISSNPVSPGSSSPPLNQPRPAEFVPPTRPSSTPFPHPDHRSSSFCCDEIASDPDALGLQDQGLIEMAAVRLDDPALSHPAPTFESLPAEIHESILDHIFGYRISMVVKRSPHRKWNKSLRYARRKELSDLCLVNRMYQGLVQQRLFQHLRIKGKTHAFYDLIRFLRERPHIRQYPQHIEVWFPVFQQTSRLLTEDSDYAAPDVNMTLENVFTIIATFLPNISVLTLDGGDRRKAPQITFWDEPFPGGLPTLVSVRSLITKGQWNLLRSEHDFAHLFVALPYLTEWQGSYSKPKSKAHISLAAFLPIFPPDLRHLNIVMEPDLKREIVTASSAIKVMNNSVHFCGRLAYASRGLENLSYTGRACPLFFDRLVAGVDPRNSILKSVDITLKNCCHTLRTIGESGSGMQNMHFIRAFELLVLSAIRALPKLPMLKYLRIRFIDLDCFFPALNPFFTIKDGICTGVWSEKIVDALNDARPDTRFEDLSDTFGEVSMNHDGQLVFSPASYNAHIISLKLDNYATIAPIIALP